MSEFYINYSEIEKFVDECINSTEDNERLKKRKADILVALTGDLKNNNDEVKEMVSLWQNQQEKPSQLLLNNKYIRIDQVMMEFFKVACTSGLLDMFIEYFAHEEIPAFTFATSTSVVFGLWDLFSSVSELNDWDFCVYLQAVKHHKKHKAFTFEELKSWLPSGEDAVCNIDTDIWECDYMGENKTCKILVDEKLEEALESLQRKGLLYSKKEDKRYTYRFKR